MLLFSILPNNVRMYCCRFLIEFEIRNLDIFLQGSFAANFGANAADARIFAADRKRNATSCAGEGRTCHLLCAMRSRGVEFAVRFGIAQRKIVGALLGLRSP